MKERRSKGGCLTLIMESYSCNDLGLRVIGSRTPLRWRGSDSETVMSPGVALVGNPGISAGGSASAAGLYLGQPDILSHSILHHSC